MYNELEEYLLGYLPADYWYDEGVDIARDIISGFKEDDWKQLSERLSLQNNEWKKSWHIVCMMKTIILSCKHY